MFKGARAAEYLKKVLFPNYLDEEQVDNLISPTVQNMNGVRSLLDTVSVGLYPSTALPKTVEAGSNVRVIVNTAHGAIKGDIIRFNSGTAIGLEIPILGVPDANTMVLASTLPSTVAIADEFFVMKWVTPSYDSSGALTTVSGPIQFIQDGIATVVVEDTVTPANNIPLPVKLTSVTGDINITAGDLNVQLTDQGANPDVTKIGDGTTRLGITLSNEAKVNDSSANTTLTTISGKLPATLGQKAMAAALAVSIASDQSTLPVSAASLPLPSGAATSALQTTGNTTLSSLLTELQLKADLSETQPVSAATLPLPSGAATSALQTTGNTSLSSIDGKFTTLNAKDFATSALQTTGNASLSSMDGKFTTLNAKDFATSALQTTLNSSVSTMSGKLPAALGQTTMANSMSVTLASNQSTVSVKEQVSDGTPEGTTATVTLAVGTISAPAGNPYQVWLQADIANADNIRVTLNGITPSATNGWQLAPGASIGPINTSVAVKHIAEVTTGQKLNYIWTTRS